MRQGLLRALFEQLFEEQRAKITQPLSNNTKAENCSFVMMLNGPEGLHRRGIFMGGRGFNTSLILVCYHQE